MHGSLPFHPFDGVCEGKLSQRTHYCVRQYGNQLELTFSHLKFTESVIPKIRQDPQLITMSAIDKKLQRFFDLINSLNLSLPDIRRLRYRIGEEVEYRNKCLDRIALRDSFDDLKRYLTERHREIHFSSGPNATIKEELKELLREIREDGKWQGGQGNDEREPGETTQQSIRTPRDQTLTRIANGQVSEKPVKSPQQSANSIFRFSELDTSSQFSTFEKNGISPTDIRLMLFLHDTTS